MYSVSLLILERMKAAVIFVRSLILQQAFHYSQRSHKLRAKPHHHWASDKILCFLSDILARQLQIQQNNLYNLTRQCYWPHWLARQVNWHTEVVSAFKFPHSSVNE